MERLIEYYDEAPEALPIVEGRRPLPGWPQQVGGLGSGWLSGQHGWLPSGGCLQQVGGLVAQCGWSPKEGIFEAAHAAIGIHPGLFIGVLLQVPCRGQLGMQNLRHRSWTWFWPNLYFFSNVRVIVSYDGLQGAIDVQNLEVRYRSGALRWAAVRVLRAGDA